MAEPRESNPLGTFSIMGTLAAAVIVLYGIGVYSGILGPLFLTISLFIAAYPIQTKLAKMGVPKPIASSALGVVVITILVGFFLVLSWSVTSMVTELPKYNDAFISLYKSSLDWLASIGIDQAALNSAVDSINLSSLSGILQGTVRSVTSTLTLLAVLVTMIFMMAIDSSTFRRRNDVLKKAHPRVWRSMRDYTVGVRRYWVVTSVFGLIVAVIDTLALWWLGVPLALVWGVLSFLTNFIPNIGFFIGIVPPTLMALLANGPWTALLVIVIYVVANFIIQSVIQPKYNGDAVGVTATVALLSLLLWSAVLGPLGALIALPMTLLGKALFIDPEPNLRWLNAFISNEPKKAMGHRDSDDSGG